MENKVTLQFSKSITRLAGYKYGLSEYENQCKNKIDFKKPIIIEFPDNIEKLASSFIQGFFAEFIKEIGYDGIEKNVDIISGSNLKEQVMNNLI